MKMEDMPLSGPDNTRLEVRYYLCIQVPMHLPNIGFVFGVTLCFCCCRPWPMTSTLSWWKMPVWACVLRCIELLNRAISSWMKRTKRAWRSLVGAIGSGFYSVCLQCVCLLFFFCLFVFPLQKLWINQEWTYLGRCTISGRTKSVSVPTVKD